jgi:hypothetical protein
VVFVFSASHLQLELVHRLTSHNPASSQPSLLTTQSIHNNLSHPNLGGFFISEENAMQKRRPTQKSATQNKPRTNEALVKAIQKCAKKLKRIPGFRDLEKIGIGRGLLETRWGGLQPALAAAGIEAAGTGFRHSNSTLLLDWAKVVRKQGRIPSVSEYRKLSRFCHAPLHARFGWKLVPEAFEEFAQDKALQEEWADVLAIIAARPRKGSRCQISTARKSQSVDTFPERPIYGNPLPWPELLHEPVNEGGVVFAFGMMARRLGFAVRRIQRAFPDCEALREVSRNQWQMVRIEFEFESRNFVLHQHDPNGCDVIVCWVHNWPECPVNIEVVELCKEARRWGWAEGMVTETGADNRGNKLSSGLREKRELELE